MAKEKQDPGAEDQPAGDQASGAPEKQKAPKEKPAKDGGDSGEKGGKEKASKEKSGKDKGGKDKGAKPEKGGKEKAGKDAEPEVMEPPPPPRLRTRYNEMLGSLAEKIGRKNPHSLPRLKKIVVNMGVGTATTEKKHLEEAVQSMTQITGQKPLVTLARISVAGFKLREGMQIGCKTTLRGARMFEFLDRLISVALPRVRDFRGLNPNGFDGNGNYNLGLSEQLVFPELNPDKFQRPQGLNVTIVIGNSSDAESRELLQVLGLPFRA